MESVQNEKRNIIAKLGWLDKFVDDVIDLGCMPYMIGNQLEMLQRVTDGEKDAGISRTNPLTVWMAVFHPGTVDYTKANRILDSFYEMEDRGAIIKRHSKNFARLEISDPFPTKMIVSNMPARLYAALPLNFRFHPGVESMTFDVNEHHVSINATTDTRGYEMLCGQDSDRVPVIKVVDLRTDKWAIKTVKGATSGSWTTYAIETIGNIEFSIKVNLIVGYIINDE